MLYRLLFIMFVSALALCADEVILTSGSKLQGEVTKVTDTEVVLEAEGAAMNFPLSLVHAVIKNGKRTEYNPLKNKMKPKPAPVKTKPAPAKPAIEEKKGSGIPLAVLQKGGKLPAAIGGAQANKFWAPVSVGRTSAKDMKRSIGMLVGLVENNTSDPSWPWWQLKLGNSLVDMNQDAAAYGIIEKLIALPDNTPTNPKIKEAPAIPEIRKKAIMLKARILGRNGHAAEAEAAIKEIAAPTSYQRMLIAEMWVQCGKNDKAKTILNGLVGKTDGHPGGGWGNTYIPMRAAALAHLMGEHALALKLGQRVVDRGENAEKFSMWKGGWHVTKQIVENAKQKKTVNINALSDGRYTGSARGFDDQIEVEVVIARKQIKTVKVTKNRESRPYGSLEAIPGRIVKQQSLNVDCVSGATITSLAVINAVEDALAPE